MATLLLLLHSSLQRLPLLGWKVNLHQMEIKNSEVCPFRRGLKKIVGLILQLNPSRLKPRKKQNQKNSWGWLLQCPQSPVGLDDGQPGRGFSQKKMLELHLPSLQANWIKIQQQWKLTRLCSDISAAWSREYWCNGPHCPRSSTAGTRLCAAQWGSAAGQPFSWLDICFFFFCKATLQIYWKPSIQVDPLN